jgi:hypothetical protein
MGAAVAAATSAVHEAECAWAAARVRIEEDCRALHDVRVAALTDAVAAKQELREAVGGLRLVAAVRRGLQSLQVGLAKPQRLHSLAALHRGAGALPLFAQVCVCVLQYKCTPFVASSILLPFTLECVVCYTPSPCGLLLP